MWEVIGAVATLIATLLGIWINDRKPKVERDEDKLDKAIAKRDGEAASALLSDRIDKLQ